MISQISLPLYVPYVSTLDSLISGFNSDDYSQITKIWNNFISESSSKTLIPISSKQQCMFCNEIFENELHECNSIISHFMFSQDDLSNKSLQISIQKPIQASLVNEILTIYKQYCYGFDSIMNTKSLTLIDSFKSYVPCSYENMDIIPSCSFISCEPEPYFECHTEVPPEESEYFESSACFSPLVCEQVNFTMVSTIYNTLSIITTIIYTITIISSIISTTIQILNNINNQVVNSTNVSMVLLEQLLLQQSLLQLSLRSSQGSCSCSCLSYYGYYFDYSYYYYGFSTCNDDDGGDGGDFRDNRRAFNFRFNNNEMSMFKHKKKQMFKKKAHHDKRHHNCSTNWASSESASSWHAEIAPIAISA